MIFVKDDQGQPIYYKKFLKPDFMPTLAQPAQPINKGNFKKKEPSPVKGLKNLRNKMGLVSLNATPNAVNKGIFGDSDSEELPNLLHSADQVYEIDYDLIKRYVESDPEIDVRSNSTVEVKKRVRFESDQDGVYEKKKSNKERLNVDDETQEALQDCLNLMDNKLVMPKFGGGFSIKNEAEQAHRKRNNFIFF